MGLQQTLVIIRSLAVVAGFIFALAELRGKKRHVVGLIVSAALALTAEVGQWLVTAYETRSSEQMIHELVRSRYPLGKFHTAITLRIPSQEVSIVPYVERWKRFVRGKVAEHASEINDDEWWISDEAMGIGIKMRGQQLLHINFSETSALLSPIDESEGVLTDSLRPTFFLAFARDHQEVLTAENENTLWNAAPGCDLAVLLCYFLDEKKSYDVQYLAGQERVELMAQDPQWHILHETGALTSFVDLPGYHLVIVVPFSEADLKGVSLSAGDMSYGHGKSLMLKGDRFAKSKKWNQTIFSYQLKRDDIGVLKSLSHLEGAGRPATPTAEK